MRRAVSVAAGCVVLAAGCEQPRTELVVRVDSEVAWGAGAAVQAITLTVRRSGPTGPLRSARTTALGAGGERRSLPLLAGILPGDDLDTPVWIEALGCGDPNGCSPSAAVVAQRAVVRFTRGQTEEVTLLLASACVGVTCASDERCATNGHCEAATLARVRPFDGTATDAGVGGAAFDALAADRETPIDRSDLGGQTDVQAPDIWPEDVPATDVTAVDTAASCGALELRCGGACVAALRDPLNCGACGEVCPAVAGATPTCMGGRCGYACDAAHADCDERPSNGCESERSTDHDHCGACGRACDEARHCVGGECTLCRGDSPLWCPGTGCTSRNVDPRNCGGCGVACPLGAVCRANSCTYVACTPSSPPPDAGDPRNWTMCPAGCVDVQTDPRNCGRCGNVCPDPPNGYAGCRRGFCGVSGCHGSWGDCDGIVGNGCETNIEGNLRNCGECARDCVMICARIPSPCGASCRCIGGTLPQCNCGS